MRKHIAATIVVAAWLAATLAGVSAADAQPKKVTVQMDWVIGGAHGGFFVANTPGTDWIPTIPLCAEDKAKLLSGNAERLLRL